MISPLRPALDRISRGFTTPQKIGLTIAGLLWVVSPLDGDFIPLLGWLDDGVVIYLIKQLWAGPTLPSKSGSGSGSGTALKAQVAAAFTRARKDFAEGFANGRRDRS